MIDFACKQFKINEIIKCALGLTKAELKIIEYFLENSSFSYTTNEIAKKLSLNLTTIQKAVKKLNEKNIIIRKQNNLTGGGYVFIYELNNKKEIRSILNNIIKSWSIKVEEEIRKL